MEDEQRNEKCASAEWTIKVRRHNDDGRKIEATHRDLKLTEDFFSEIRRPI